MTCHTSCVGEMQLVRLVSRSYQVDATKSFWTTSTGTSPDWGANHYTRMRIFWSLTTRQNSRPYRLGCPVSVVCSLRWYDVTSSPLSPVVKYVCPKLMTSGPRITFQMNIKLIPPTHFLVHKFRHNNLDNESKNKKAIKRKQNNNK